MVEYCDQNADADGDEPDFEHSMEGMFNNVAKKTAGQPEFHPSMTSSTQQTAGTSTGGATVFFQGKPMDQS